MGRYSKALEFHSAHNQTITLNGKKYKYSDNCCCDQCGLVFAKAVLAALDRPRKKTKRKK